MILFKHSKDLQFYLNLKKNKKLSIGFVPTMGALHQGHISLIKQSRLTTQITICSIFVNPVQFNNPEDFKKYPSTIENDIVLLEQNNCDILFYPSEDEIYPDENSKNKFFELGNLEKILEGKYRPGHFQGVCNVMDKLISIINPSVIFLGQKDYQQCLVIKKLIGILKKKITISICPILRERNGLAMSSRNLRLGEKDKEIASQLYKTLKKIKHNLLPGNFPTLKKEAIIKLQHKGFTIDYLELAKSNKFTLVNDCTMHANYIVLVAAFLNKVRLIDNMVIKM